MYRWSFAAGEQTLDELAFSGAFDDHGLDSDHDGLYDSLVVRVGVQVAASGTYALSGRLVDRAGEPVAAAGTQLELGAGAHFAALIFDGAQIGGRGMDGPFILTGLTLTRVDGSGPFPTRTWMDAYRTFAYQTGQFPAPLRFGGLPDLQVDPGSRLEPALNVHDYAQHAILAPDQLTYTLVQNTFLEAGVTLEPDGDLRVVPDPGWPSALEGYPGLPGWTGVTRITLQASDGTNSVQDSFDVKVGWGQNIYLPVVTREMAPGTPQSAPDGWRTAIFDDFEEPPEARWGLIGPGSEYFWSRRDCSAYSGSYSFWPFGGAMLPALPLDCGAPYLNSERIAAVTLPEYSLLQNMTVNLKYARAAELTMKVQTDLAPGDQLCALVEGGATYNLANYAGVCRSGQTAGWEDLALDLAAVPDLGSLLGAQDVRVAVDFRSDAAGTRPFGAYVDDLRVRACLDGLPCEGLAAAPAAPPLVTGPLGGFTETVLQAALGMEAGGRLHALWTGELPYFDEEPARRRFVFYATSTDGVHWTRARALNTEGADPQIAVDDVHGRVHLMYTAYGQGVLHHTVSAGTVSAPSQVGTGLRPHLAVDPATGAAHAVWHEFYLQPLEAPQTWTGRYRTWYAAWESGKWSDRREVINNPDTFSARVAAAPGGGVMLAWFQDWQRSAGDGTTPGDPIVARTAYGDTPGAFSLRQAAHALYPPPERDESIHLVFSGGDGAYYLASAHLMWPGHYRTYRYRWENGAWSGPLDVSQNTSGTAVPVYAGAAADRPHTVYLYSLDGSLYQRAESGGVLGAQQPLSAYLAARGYTGDPLAYFTGPAGELHLLVAGTYNGTSGLFYVRP